MNRLILGVILFSVILGFGIYYNSEFERHKEYPSIGDAVLDPSKYIGKKVVIWSHRVVDIGDNTFTIEVTDQRFTVTNASKVDVGDRVEVLGTLEPGYRITAEKIIVSKEWKYYFIFVRSIVAIPLVLFLFFRNWKFDFKRFEFRGRE